MGNSCSADDNISEDEEYHIPISECQRHPKSTVQAPHQLTFLLQPQNCDYCRIAKKTTKENTFPSGAPECLQGWSEKDH